MPGHMTAPERHMTLTEVHHFIKSLEQYFGFQVTIQGTVFEASPENKGKHTNLNGVNDSAWTIQSGEGMWLLSQRLPIYSL